MKNRFRDIFLLLASSLTVFALVVGCSHHRIDSVPVLRLDRILADFSKLDDAQQLDVVDSLAPEIDAMFAVLGHDVVTVGMLDRWSHSQVVDVFQPDVDSVFPDLSYLERQIGHILLRTHADSLALPEHMRFVAVTWGNPRPIVRVDTVVLIALNHFLGADYAGYQGWPDFRVAEKTPEALPYSIASALVATSYPMTVDHPSLLTWMLYEGVLVHARMQLVPNATLDLALGYTPAQLKAADDNLSRIWDEMALRRLIYDTDPVTIDRYVAPAPNTPLLNGEAPGRIARYVGYQIVKSYLAKHQHVSLKYLLSPQFYGSAQSLIDSGFRP